MANFNRIFFFIPFVSIPNDFYIELECRATNILMKQNALNNTNYKTFEMILPYENIASLRKWNNIDASLFYYPMLQIEITNLK